MQNKFGVGDIVKRTTFGEDLETPCMIVSIFYPKYYTMLFLHTLKFSDHWLAKFSEEELSRVPVYGLVCSKTVNALSMDEMQLLMPEKHYVVVEDIYKTQQKKKEVYAPELALEKLDMTSFEFLSLVKQNFLGLDGENNDNYLF